MSGCLRDMPGSSIVKSYGAYLAVKVTKFTCPGKTHHYFRYLFWHNFTGIGHSLILQSTIQSTINSTSTILKEHKFFEEVNTWLFLGHCNYSPMEILITLEISDTINVILNKNILLGVISRFPDSIQILAFGVRRRWRLDEDHSRIQTDVIPFAGA